MPQVYIGVGANLGDRKSNFEFAAQNLLADGRIWDPNYSPVYETEPVGAEGQPQYWNAVWRFETKLSPHDLLQRMHEIEARAGRKRSFRNEARVLDLDLLFYGNETCDEKDCIIPHPRLHERAFVLAPFSDLAPEFVHPVLKKTVQALWNELKAKGGTRGIKRVF